MDLNLLCKGERYFLVTLDKNEQGLFDPKYVSVTYIDEGDVKEGPFVGHKTYMFGRDGTVYSIKDCMSWCVYDNEYRAKEATQSIINYLSSQSVSPVDKRCPFGQCVICPRLDGSVPGEYCPS